MPKVLFVPLNTNHVLIFESIIKSLRCPYEVLCHDMISDSPQYHTENTLKKLGIVYRHFPGHINRSPSDTLPIKIINCLRLKSMARNILTAISPTLLVLAIDSDPITQLFIEESKKRGIKTVLVQESLMRPYQYTLRRRYFSDILYKVLRLCGIYLSYIVYGSGMCDIVLASGTIPKKIFAQRGVPENRIFIVGYPKYDTILVKIDGSNAGANQNRVFVFAASTGILQDNANKNFLIKLTDAIIRLGTRLIIKLHPRSTTTPQEIYEIINVADKSAIEVIKEGDDTFDILKRSDVLITVSSTVILEALMMNKECVTVNYLAGESILDYQEYDAVYSIDSENQIFDVIKATIESPKNQHNKKKLLEDEVFKLDGQAGHRAAAIIEQFALSS